VRQTPRAWRVSFTYKLYRVGGGTEPCGTPAYISWGVGILPSTETLNFLVRIKFDYAFEICKLDNLYKPGSMWYQGLFSISTNTAVVYMCVCVCIYIYVHMLTYLLTHSLTHSLTDSMLLDII
jgi:hypothetical protein